MTSKLDTAGLAELERWTVDAGADVEALKLLLRPATLERFLSHIESGTPDECWGWTGSVIKKDGRGTFSLGRSAHTAPRIILALHSHRWAASDVMACHECDNPNCVNPKHLWWGSNAENLLDASIKGRLRNNQVTHCPKGHPLSGSNLSIVKGNQRRCNACHIEYKRRRRAALREKGLSVT